MRSETSGGESVDSLESREESPDTFQGSDITKNVTNSRMRNASDGFRAVQKWTNTSRQRERPARWMILIARTNIITHTQVAQPSRKTNKRQRRRASARLRG